MALGGATARNSYEIFSGGVTASRICDVACSRNAVVCGQWALLRVWVFAIKGKTCCEWASSMKSRAAPPMRCNLHKLTFFVPNGVLIWVFFSDDHHECGPITPLHLLKVGVILCCCDGHGCFPLWAWRSTPRLSFILLKRCKGNWVVHLNLASAKLEGGHRLSAVALINRYKICRTAECLSTSTT